MVERTARGWTVINGGGHALAIFARTRREAISAATQNLGGVTWAKLRSRWGCRVVKATLTYEAPDGR